MAKRCSDSKGRELIEGQSGKLIANSTSGRARNQHGQSINRFFQQTVSEAVRLLDRSGFRLIRSEDDLLDCVLETLLQFQQDVGHDLAMLYEAPNRKGGEERPRKHLEEDALQAYLRRRLLERLPMVADKVEVEIIREDQIARRQRLDLRVTAPCRGSGRLATVVVEIKWSTNDETRSGLVSQLGDRYLLGERRSRGEQQILREPIPVR